MEILELQLASIEVGTDRARPLDPAWVEGLAGSIREQGLLQPIVVRQKGDGYRLIAGHHRIAAVQSMGWATVAARVSDAESDDAAKLAEVMENLGRHELIALDRCHHLNDLKQVWLRIHPEAAAGGDRKSIKAQNLRFDPDGEEILGFGKTVAEKIGLSVRTIEVAVKIWTGLAPQTRQRLQGVDLAKKQTELKALSEIATPRRQGEVLDAILNPQLPDVGNVAQALAYLGEGVVCDPLEKRFMTISRSIADLDDATFDDVISSCEERVITSLKRRGRI